VSLPIRFRDEVWTELRDAVLWYEEKEPGLGPDFIRSFEGIIANLARNPLVYPTVHNTARRAVMRRFPYSVIHVVTDAEILIVSVIHSHRDPQRWQSGL
jgi:toxin ParE1/3/4